VERAAQLYLEGWSAILLPSGNRWLFHGGKGSTESEAMREIAMRAGVPDSAILCEDKARHTVDNARLSAQILNERGIVVKSAIICCQAFHARRCLQDYQREFPGVRLAVCPANTRGICRESWYKTPLGICKIITELMKCTWIFYFLISKVGQGRLIYNSKLF
jgi:uncharacterized SAM-binding protein YcdF (DUF218 family)